MTDAPHLSEAPAAMPATIGLQHVDPAFTSVLRIGVALFWVPLAIGLTALDVLLIGGRGGGWGVVTALGWLLAIGAILVLPQRRYARIGYALGHDDLRVVRGYLFRVDTIVPFVRVQHIDVGQGPVERRYGLSHLIVHTSGTHNSTVTLPGLPTAEAATMREAIRQQIQSDFA